jgi:uncharacterized protein GlcG (DUF336 family)
MPTRNTKSLTTKGIRMIMDGAAAKAKEYGIAVTVAIVDSGGHLLMLERMEGGRFHTVYSATTKAVSAASNRRPTGMRGAQGQSLDTIHALGLALAAGPHNWTPMEGGFPIVFDGECVGGIGVSGGTWEQDAEVAKAGLAAVGTGPGETKGPNGLA